MYKFVLAVGSLDSNISAGTTLVPLTSAAADQLASFLADGDWTYLEIKNGYDREVVKVTGMTGTAAVVVRNVDSTGAKAFPQGATVCSVLPYSAVVDIIEQVGVPADITFEGTNAVTVSDSYGLVQIDAPIVTIVGEEGGGIDVLGEFPDFRLALTNPSGCCDDSGGTGSNVSLVGYGLVNVEFSDETYQITVEEPTFSGDGNIEVSGSWPYYTIGFSGSVGTLTGITAGTGLSKTGAANSPTLNIANTGVTAGTYGGIVINARGQITSVPAGLNPVSTIAVTPSTGLDVSRAGDTVTLAGVDAAEGTKGVVALADADAPLDPDDDTTAVTPALLASVVDDLAGTEIDGLQSYTGEADASYTNVIAGSSVSIDVPADGKALVILSTVVKDNVDVTNIPEYGIALFNTSPARIQASPILKQQMQVMHAVIAGPVTASLVIVTTDLTGYSLSSYSLQVVVI